MHLPRAILLLSVLCVVLHTIKAQQLDSLWSVWNDHSLPDTARMQAMDYITFDHYMYNKPDTAYVLAGLVLELAQRIGNTRYEAWAYNARAAALQMQGDYPGALDDFKRSKVILEKRGDKRRLTQAESNLGQIMHELGENAKALEHYNRSLELARERKDTLAEGATLINLAAILRDDGDTLGALAMYDRAVSLNSKPGHERDLSIALYNSGIQNSRLGRYDIARTRFEQSTELAHQLKDSGLLAMAYRGWGGMDLRLGNNASALANGKRSLQLAQQAGLAWETVECAHLVYAAHKALGQPALALPAYELHVRMRDSLNKEENRVEVARANVRTAYEKEMLIDSLAYSAELAQMDNARTIERLRADRNRNRIWVSAGAAVLLLAGLTAFFFSDRKRRQARFERDAAELETQALRSQMNPHFIFNALNSISAFVQENATATAVSFLTRFARLMRLVLENSRHTEVPLKDDLEALDAYLHLERVRCNERFEYAIHVDPDIDPERVMVPPLVAQPFVENAIWHGMAGKDGTGHITLRFSMKGEDLLVAIEDDGGGRAAAKSGSDVSDSTAKKRSLGTTITQARLDLVGKQRGRPAGFRYVDLPQGTRVELNLPVELD